MTTILIAVAGVSATLTTCTLLWIRGERKRIIAERQAQRLKSEQEQDALIAELEQGMLDLRESVRRHQALEQAMQGGPQAMVPFFRQNPDLFLQAAAQMEAVGFPAEMLRQMAAEVGISLTVN